MCSGGTSARSSVHRSSALLIGRGSRCFSRLDGGFQVLFEFRRLRLGTLCAVGLQLGGGGCRPHRVGPATGEAHAETERPQPMGGHVAKRGLTLHGGWMMQEDTRAIHVRAVGILLDAGSLNAKQPTACGALWSERVFGHELAGRLQRVVMR